MLVFTHAYSFRDRIHHFSWYLEWNGANILRIVLNNMFQSARPISACRKIIPNVENFVEEYLGFQIQDGYK